MSGRNVMMLTSIAWKSAWKMLEVKKSATALLMPRNMVPKLSTGGNTGELLLPTAGSVYQPGRPKTKSVTCSIPAWAMLSFFISLRSAQLPPQPARAHNACKIIHRHPQLPKSGCTQLVFTFYNSKYEVKKEPSESESSMTGISLASDSWQSQVCIRDQKMIL